MRPPDLIIQDEFHLISGPLGTMVGLYETAVDDLCTLAARRDEGPAEGCRLDGDGPTRRGSGAQRLHAAARRSSRRTPSTSKTTSFRCSARSTSKPGRRYLGICAPGSSRPAVLIRTYTAFLTAAQALFDRFGPVADPYMTLVGYFNSLREFGGMKRLAEDDVQTRSFRVKMSLVERPGLAQRRVGDVRELTSRVSSRDIPKYLDQLEVPFDGDLTTPCGAEVGDEAGTRRPAADRRRARDQHAVGRRRRESARRHGRKRPTQGHGRVHPGDEPRRPRVPGLVATVLTWARPRDLSHYETFEHYHATFYQHVEAQSVTPFSPRAMDRGLTGTMLRHAAETSRSVRPERGGRRADKPEPAGDG